MNKVNTENSGTSSRHTLSSQQVRGCEAIRSQKFSCPFQVIDVAGYESHNFLVFSYPSFHPMALKLPPKVRRARPCPWGKHGRPVSPALRHVILVEMFSHYRDIIEQNKESESTSNLDQSQLQKAFCDGTVAMGLV